VVEQVTVNHLVAGSIPARAANRRAVKARLAHGLRPADTKNVNALVAEARRMAPSLSRGTCVVYFLRLRSGILYVGASIDLEQRIDDHISGHACRTTALDPPVALLRVEVCSTFSEARRREAQLKRWSRPKKEALVRDDYDRLRKLSQSRDLSAGGGSGVSANC
jgi:putative endonuclease